MKATFKKTDEGLIPADSKGQEFYEKVKIGDIVCGEFTKKQNAAFHSKMFALLNVGFDNWKQPEIEITLAGKKVVPEKNFERFRKDLTILAGFYHTVFRVDGSYRVEADSLSYDKMTPEKREAIYSKFIDVLLKSVYEGLKREDIDKLTETYLAFT